MVNTILQDKISAALGGGVNFYVYIPALNYIDSISLDDLSAYAGQTGASPFENSLYDGSKFYDGFGTTQLQTLDYWTLRARSSQLFNENLYARGLIRRLVTNEINTGLSPEAAPDENILGVPDDSLVDWTENVENRFGIWGKNPKVCDHKRVNTFSALQRYVKQEAYINGDILVVLRHSRTTRLPTIQLINGSQVQTPLLGDHKIRNDHSIKHGVEFDRLNRVVAHWVRQTDGSYKRLAAFGEKTGRRISWLVFGTDKRLDDVRGQPLLAIVLQSLKEIDRYRDSTQRKAVINSILAMFIKKGENKMGTLPVTGGAKRKGSVTTTDVDGSARSFKIAQQIPGLVMEELQHGEEPVGFDGKGTDVNFPIFEAAIIQAVAWANEVPPEILTLAFSNNYSASQAAINEFKIYINRVWCDFGENFCTPIYVEWLISETLLNKINAPGLLESWRSLNKYDIFGAWTATDWYGSIKPSTDMLKQGKGSEILVKNGWSTNAREARITTGTKFSKNVKRLKTENKLIAEMLEPILALKAKFGDAGVEDAINALGDNIAAQLTDVSDNA
jgi:capsid protein